MLCVFPDERSDLAQAISELWLNGGHPVIVLIAGDIDEQQAIQAISRIGEDMSAVVVCGG